MNYKYKLIDLKYLENKSADEILSFLRFNGIVRFDRSDIKSLKKLMSNINNKADLNISYVIDRIDKEFDIVKIGNNTIVNIEMKLSHKDLSQCKKNYKIFEKYYKDYEINIYCYEEKSDSIYLYDCNNNLMKKTTFNQLNNNLDVIERGKLLNINVDINSIYLKPDFFIKGSYNLSKGQLMTKTNINNCNERVIALNGRAGTGKSLLALDLYSDYYFSSNDAIFLAPFKKNDIIHKDLRNHFPIKTIREFKSEKKKYSVCIVDEAQRMTLDDFKSINDLIRDKIILFGDPNQSIDNERFFKEMIGNKHVKTFNINQIIRSDDSFDVFATKALKKDTKEIRNKKVSPEKIEILMLDDSALEGLNEYVFLEPAKGYKWVSCIDKCENKFCCGISNKCLQKLTPYDTISRDYNNVCMLFCDAYEVVDGKIESCKKVCYGNLDDQLYSLMTRTVEKLRIITTDICVYNYLCKIKESILE